VLLAQWLKHCTNNASSCLTGCGSPHRFGKGKSLEAKTLAKWFAETRGGKQEPAPQGGEWEDGLFAQLRQIAIRQATCGLADSPTCQLKMKSPVCRICTPSSATEKSATLSPLVSTSTMVWAPTCTAWTAPIVPSKATFVPRKCPMLPGV
jgi:hypothetical protein